jgi:hypothetical protein
MLFSSLLMGEATLRFPWPASGYGAVLGPHRHAGSATLAIQRLIEVC